MRNLFLILIIVANACFISAEEFIVRLHVKENATKENIPVDCFLYKSNDNFATSERMYHIVERKGDGEFELKFDKRPEAKDNYELFIFPLYTYGRSHRNKIIGIVVPKKAKSPYDMDVMMWGKDEYMPFDSTKSFTVIVHTKDSLTKEPVSMFSAVNLTKCKNWREYGDWAATVKKTAKNDLIEITFMGRPKADEKWELTIFGRRDSNGEQELKVVPIEIPKKAKSPYRMPDVLMPGPGIRSGC